MESFLFKMKSTIQDLGDEDMKHKMNVLKKYMVSLTEPYTFERLVFIHLPSKGSISSIQANVKRARMGHGKAPNKTRCN